MDDHQVALNILIKQQPIMSLSINKQILLSQPIIAKTEDPTSFAFNPKKYGLSFFSLITKSREWLYLLSLQASHTAAL
jgi:hypothetical protein